MKAKNVWLALVLTIVMPGLGYIYLGRKLLFGIFLLISNITALMWFVSLGENFVVNLFFILGLVSYYGAMLLDTYYTTTTLHATPPMKADPASSVPAATHDKTA